MRALGGTFVLTGTALLLLGLIALGSFATDAAAQSTPHCDGATLWDARVGRCAEDPRLRCAAGDLTQCLVVAEHYRDPTSADRDLRLATTYYERACAGGEHAACGVLGTMALFGEGQPRDLERAGRFLTRACDGKHITSCTRLGEVALAIRQNPRAMTLWTLACDLGDVRGCTWVTDRTRTGAERCDALSAGCTGESTLACALLSVRVAADECTWEAEHRLQRTAWACEAGEPEACVQWARLLEQTGSNSDSNPRARLTWACEAGHVGACTTLAAWLDAGTMGPRSAPLSERYAKQACDEGSLESCVRMANHLIVRSRSTEHSARIASALNRGCDAAIPTACRVLGDAALKGRGVIANRELAERAFVAGCTQNDPVSCERAADVFGYRAAQAEDESDRKHDWARAAEALGHACRLNRPRACVRFGLLTLHGFTENARAAHEAMLTGCSQGAPDGCLYAGRQLAAGHGIEADRARALALLQQACTAGSVLACGDFEDDTLTTKLDAGPAFPMPYGAGVVVPAEHRVAPARTETVASNVPINPTGEASTDGAPIAAPEVVPTAVPDDDFELGLDVGFSGTSGGHAARLVGTAHARFNATNTLTLDVPLLVADADLHAVDAVGEPPRSANASTFRFGNVTLGGRYTESRPWGVWHAGLGLVVPTAVAPDVGEEEMPTLERELATRAYQLALAVDGLRSAWRFRPNMSGAVAHIEARNTDARLLLQGSAHLAALMPLRGELNADVVLQLEGTAGMRIGPALLGVRSSLVALADDEIAAISVAAIAAATDASGHVWSLRATWLPDASAWNVPTWGLSAAVGTDLP